MRAISILEYIDRSMWRLRWVISFIMSILITITVGIISTEREIANESNFMDSTTPYISYLIEAGDRPEVIRILSSHSRARGTKISIEIDGLEYANTHDISKIDNKTVERSGFKIGKNLLLKSSSITLRKEIKSISGSSSRGYIFSEISTTVIVEKIFLILAISFLSCFIILYFASRKLEFYLKETIRPLQELEKEVQNIHNDNFSSKELKFKELETVRQSVVETKKELNEKNTRIANQKSKEINSEIYRRLIHDLQNPITALKTMTNLVADPSTPKDIRDEAISVVPGITEEILNQIIAAKNNFEFDISKFQLIDIRSTIHTSIQQIKAAREGTTKLITFHSPDSPIFVPCDPLNIKRALINIIENGLESCREKIEIKIDQKMPTTSIFISDDGDGLEESKLAEILKGNGISKKGNRQALGLCSVNHILLTHNGSLGYRTSQFGGAEFELRIGSLC